MGSYSYTYDACGRTRTIQAPNGTNTLSYDYEDRLTSITGPGYNAAYAYNGADARVAATGTAGNRTFRRDGVGVTAPVLSDGVATMVPGISERANGVTRFAHLDRLGTSARTTDVAGSTVDTKRYDAFGMPIQLLNPSGSRSGFAGAYGYQEDPDTGLKLLGHRYYDCATGRFLTRDPIGSGLNWYKYADNNPTLNIDPNGLKLRTLTDKEDPSRGFNSAEQAQIEAWKKEMRTTKRGTEILDELENDPIDHVIKKALDSDPIDKRDPHADAKDVFLRLDKKYAIETSDGPAGWVRMSNTRILAHELGHLLKDPSKTGGQTYGDDGRDKMNNINANENPVATQLKPKQPRRSSYLWAIYDPMTGAYIDPYSKKRHYPAP